MPLYESSKPPVQSLCWLYDTFPSTRVASSFRLFLDSVSSWLHFCFWVPGNVQLSDDTWSIRCIIWGGNSHEVFLHCSEMLTKRYISDSLMYWTVEMMQNCLLNRLSWFRSGIPSPSRQTHENRRRFWPNISWKRQEAWKGWNINCMTLATEGFHLKRWDLCVATLHLKC